MDAPPPPVDARPAPARRRPVLLASAGLLAVTLAFAAGTFLQRGRTPSVPAPPPKPMEAVQVQLRTPAEADATAQVAAPPLPTAPMDVALNAAPMPPAAPPLPAPAQRTSRAAPRYVDAAASTPATAREREVYAPDTPDIRVAAPIQASFDCRRAQSYAEQAVCDDPDLAAADRRMSRAYRDALAADADPEDLRLEQADWLMVRETAARRSPGALMSVYRQRIADLRSWAEDPPD